MNNEKLCLHTLRADCNTIAGFMAGKIAHFASTRSVQIATLLLFVHHLYRVLCLHTLRADCNVARESALMQVPSPFASTRSVQIATFPLRCRSGRLELCLHTLRADCNEDTTCVPRQSSFASTRSVQIATAEMHRMQYALFRTCVELVDSFSVLNKAMLR